MILPRADLLMPPPRAPSRQAEAYMRSETNFSSFFLAAVFIQRNSGMIVQGKAHDFIPFILGELKIPLHFSLFLGR